MDLKSSWSTQTTDAKSSILNWWEFSCKSETCFSSLVERMLVLGKNGRNQQTVLLITTFCSLHLTMISLSSLKKDTSKRQLSLKQLVMDTLISKSLFTGVVLRSEKCLWMFMQARFLLSLLPHQETIAEPYSANITFNSIV